MGVYTKDEIQQQKKDRLGLEAYNNQGCLMKIVEYKNTKNITVEFQDDYKERVRATYNRFIKGSINNPILYKQRLKKEMQNYQGCMMRIHTYNSALDIIVEFNDEHAGKVHTSYNHFLSGSVKNPYFPEVYGVGIVGEKYPVSINNNIVKEYKTWRDMLRRCFDSKYKEKYTTYKDVTCCQEWLLYENFYEWLHNQENFEKWYDNKRWCLDKDILIKGNKVYSPETCCLVPENVNTLFVKNDIRRGNLPIGVCIFEDKFMAQCRNPFTDEYEYLGCYSTPMFAFEKYKHRKENIIKQVAESEYFKGNIIKECYEAMMNYEVEIDD